MLEANPRPQNYGQVLDAASSFTSLDARTEASAAGVDWTEFLQHRCSACRVRDFPSSIFSTIQKSASTIKTAYANLNDSALGVFIEEAGDPEFLKRRLGVSGGAVSQDQDYLNRHTGALQIKKPLDNPIVVDTVIAALLDSDANVSAAALDTLRKVDGVEKRADFRASMDKAAGFQQSSTQAHRDQCTKREELHRRVTRRAARLGPRLSIILSRRSNPSLPIQGRDGKACVFCHASHVIFKLEPPNADGSFLRPGQRTKLQIRHARSGYCRAGPEPDPHQAHSSDRQRRGCRQLSGHTQRRPALAWQRVERSIPDHSGMDPWSSPRSLQSAQIGAV